MAANPVKGAFTDSAFDPAPSFDFEDSSSIDPHSIQPPMTLLRGMESVHPYLDMVNGFGDQSANPSDMFAKPSFLSNWSNSLQYKVDGQVMSPNNIWDKEFRGMSFNGIGNPLADHLDQLRNEESKSTSIGADEKMEYNEDHEVAASHNTKSAGPDTKPVTSRSAKTKKSALQHHAQEGKRGSRKADSNEKSQSQSMTGSDESEDDGNALPDKRERYREKNRAAAAKCRAKKKTHVTQIEKDARTLETENVMLKAKMRELRNQHSELRNLALQHNAGVPSCHCATIHQYNLGKAAEMTSNFSMFAPVNIPSPQTGSCPSSGASPTEPCHDRRNDSFSLPTPPHLVYPAKPHSFGGPSGGTHARPHDAGSMDTRMGEGRYSELL